MQEDAKGMFSEGLQGGGLPAKTEKEIMRFILKLIYFFESRFLPKRKVRSVRFRDIKHLMKEGDIVLTAPSFQLTNLFIPGKYKHVAMYVGEGQVVEASGKGVRLRSVVDVINYAAEWCVMSPLFCEAPQRVHAVRWAASKVGGSYDWALEPCNAAFYCSELIVSAYMYCPDYRLPTTKLMGEFVYLPQGFYDDTEHWELIYEH